MGDWITIGTTFGVPLLILAVIGYFVRSAVWPLVVKRIEQADADRLRGEQERLRVEQERKEERKEFLAALERRDQTLNTHLPALTQAIERLKNKREQP